MIDSVGQCFDDVSVLDIRVVAWYNDNEQRLYAINFAALLLSRERLLILLREIHTRRENDKNEIGEQTVL